MHSIALCDLRDQCILEKGYHCYATRAGAWVDTLCRDNTVVKVLNSASGHTLHIIYTRFDYKF